MSTPACSRVRPRGGDDPKRRHMTPTSIMWRRLATQCRSMAAQSRPQAAQQPTIEKLIPKSAESALAPTVKPSKSLVFPKFFNVFHRYRFSLKSPETSNNAFRKLQKESPQLTNRPLGPEKNSHGARKRTTNPRKRARHHQESHKVTQRLPKQSP